MTQASSTEISPALAEAMRGACHCLSARKWARKLTRLYDEALSEHGLTIGQFGVMTMMAARGAASLQELADALDLDQSALSRGVAPLERDGLVASSADPSDGRRRVIGLTGPGFSKLSAAASAWKNAQEAAERKIEARRGARAAESLSGPHDQH
jgi:DNA-binding MarR family transcriptional regulator